MVDCICIDDSNRPKEIPESKWPIKGEKYRIHGLTIHIKQSFVQGCTLMEFTLDETNRPYAAYRINRFAIHINDLKKLIQLSKDCNDLREMNQSDIDETLKRILTKEIEIVEEEQELVLVEN